MEEKKHQLRFWMNMVRVVSHFSYGVDHALQEAVGIGLSEKLVLAQLAYAEGSLRMVDLAHRLGVTKAAITKLIDRLEKAGLVRRQPSLEDRRVILPLITEAGRGVVQQSRATFYAYLKAHLFDHVDPAAMDDVADLLEKVLKAEGVQLTGPVMPPQKGQ